MTEKLAQFGVQELSLAEQGEVVGGGDLGWLVGAIAGAIAGGAANALDFMIRMAAEYEYDNPRFSGTWQG